MPPPLAPPLIMLDDECLLTVEGLTERRQLNRSHFSPLHVHGFHECELYRLRDLPLSLLFGIT